MTDEINRAMKHNPVTITEAGREYLKSLGIDPDSVKTLEQFQKIMEEQKVRELVLPEEPKPKKRNWLTRLFRGKRAN